MAVIEPVKSDGLASNPAEREELAGKARESVAEESAFIDHIMVHAICKFLIENII